MQRRETNRSSKREQMHQSHVYATFVIDIIRNVQEAGGIVLILPCSLLACRTS